MKQPRVLLLCAALLFALFGCASTPFPAENVFASSSPVLPPAGPLPVANANAFPISPSPSPTPYIGPPEGYELRFAEEFDAEQIDESVWGFELGPWPYNKELESYTRENAWLEDGALVIEARKEEASNRDYTSARLTTLDQFDFTYGYLEVRAATPTGRGTWSAIWLLPSDLRYGGYLHSGEIDIMERVGYDAKLIHSTVHTYKNNAVNDSAITASARLTRRDDGFHVYSLLWLKDAIRISMDGKEVLVYPRPEQSTQDNWPFDVPFHLILNLAVGGSWGGAKGIDDDAFPQRMRIDYVRYFSPVGSDSAPE